MAAVTKLGSEFQVNTTAAGAQDNPAIAALANGGFVIAWESPDASSDGIFAQRYDANGGLDGIEMQINTTTTSQQTMPTIVGLSDGRFAVTWQSTQGTAFWQVITKIFAADGNVTTDELRLDAVANNITNTSPRAAALANGYYAVAFSPIDPSQTGIGVTIVKNDGTIDQSQTFANTFTTSYQRAPAIATLEDGGFVVIWESYNQEAHSSGSYGVFGQRFDNTWSPVGDEFQVNLKESDDQTNADVIGLANGGFLVMWESVHVEDSPGASRGVVGRLYHQYGTSISAEININTTEYGAQDHVRATALPDGGFLVTWESFNQDGSGAGVFGQRFDANGAKLGGEFQVNTTSFSTQSDPEVAVLANGGFVITWESWGQDGDQIGVFAQRYKAQLFGTTDDDTISDDIGANWIDGRSGNDDIHGNGGADVIRAGGGNDRVYGGAKNDIITGGTGLDSLDGEGGNDVIKGQGGADEIDGGAGRDDLDGGKGDDVLKPGAGGDTVRGGGGADNFFFSTSWNKNIVLDYQDGTDKITLSGFNYADKDEALTHFHEIGGVNNNKVGFMDQGTEIIINGADLSDIRKSDIRLDDGLLIM
ncbi:MAG: hypothetical protein KDJ19_05185 [Hyphomicrobiaceae bacterium]|nr:hypothetical protein [Hyphomicrobiaceae bacterium]MCC0023235.1 hypothetical protein [Hyphomicrobiaceae bacterium]